MASLLAILLWSIGDGACGNEAADRLLGVRLKIVFQSGESPIIFEAVMLHLAPGFFLGFSAVIHLVQTNDEHRAVATKIAVYVDRLIAFVAQQAEAKPVLGHKPDPGRLIRRFRITRQQSWEVALYLANTLWMI